MEIHPTHIRNPRNPPFHHFDGFLSGIWQWCEYIQHNGFPRPSINWICVSNRFALLNNLFWRLSINWSCRDKWCRMVSINWNCPNNWFRVLSTKWIVETIDFGGWKLIAIVRHTSFQRPPMKSIAWEMSLPFAYYTTRHPHWIDTTSKKSSYSSTLQMIGCTGNFPILF